ncbi:unnamed protein product [Rotaria sp. Silwood1]|nr:unnamed protein product [Rotaria sp. Silwood1]CAF4991898.1 unnamed protein product [Rotaria sp. Silwood1]
MLIDTTTGYILSAYGPYLSDSSNSDVSIQKDILINNKDGILNWIDEHDIVVGDRGFQDSTGMMRALGLDIACALINAYRAAAISSFSNDDQIAAKMLACLHESNLLRTRLNNEILHWTTNDASNIINFLVFTIDQILVIIVGM